jgi:hypothetical protein
MTTSQQLPEKGVSHEIISNSALPGVGGSASARAGNKGTQGILDEEGPSTTDDDTDD